MDNIKKVIDRKSEHLIIATGSNVEMTILNGFEKYRLIHDALPDIDFDAIDTSVEFLGKRLNAPLIISSMTGGISEAEIINQNLAKASQNLKVGFGIGSQRVVLEKKQNSTENKLTKNTGFNIRKIARDVLLFANLGAIQFNNGYTLKEAHKAVSMISADGLFIHLNPLQEAIQTEGNTNFANLKDKLINIITKFKHPLIFKEVGNGISFKTAVKLYNMGVRIVDVAGSGGTSWAYIEAKRSGKEHLASVFRNWGVPTAESLIACKKANLKVIASGGIRNGVEIAKALALGADLCGIALPFLKESLKGNEFVEEKIKELIYELKIAMFCCNVKNIKELQNNKSIITKIE